MTMETGNREFCTLFDSTVCSLEFDVSCRWCSDYVRNNKTKESKNLRCFPNCSQDFGHSLYGFCGRPILATLTILESAFASKNWLLLGSFATEGETHHALHPDGASISQTQIEGTVDEQIWLQPKVITSSNEMISNSKNGWRSIVIKFAPSNWFYNWNSNRWKSSQQHAFQVSLLTSVTPEYDMYGNSFQDTYVSQSTHAVESRFKVEAMFLSPTFTISSARRVLSKKIASNCCRADGFYWSLYKKHTLLASSNRRNDFDEEGVLPGVVETENGPVDGLSSSSTLLDAVTNGRMVDGGAGVSDHLHHTHIQSHNFHNKRKRSMSNSVDSVWKASIGEAQSQVALPLSQGGNSDVNMDMVNPTVVSDSSLASQTTGASEEASARGLFIRQMVLQTLFASTTSSSASSSLPSSFSSGESLTSSATLSSSSSSSSSSSTNTLGTHNTSSSLYTSPFASEDIHREEHYHEGTWEGCRSLSPESDFKRSIRFRTDRFSPMNDAIVGCFGLSPFSPATDWMTDNEDRSFVEVK